MDCFGGMHCCLGGLIGPLWSQSVDMGSLVRNGDGVGGLTLDFRPPVLPVVTHNRGSQEKWIVLGVCVVVWGV